MDSPWGGVGWIAWGHTDNRGGAGWQPRLSDPTLCESLNVWVGGLRIFLILRAFIEKSVN